MHIPVLQEEVIRYLDPKPNQNFIDCTIGEGGHTLAILEKNGPKGKVLGIDQDPEQIENCRLQIADFKKRLILVCNNFVNLKEIVKKEKFQKVSGILLDLGMSSWHLEKSGKGFSFLRNEPLDMRYSPENPLTAEKILNYWSLQEIERILKEYGEERFSQEIAKNIINFRKLRPIKITSQLVEIIKESIPQRFQHKRIHPATKTFQALRIAVNDELNNLEKVLLQSLEILTKNGKLVIISFHSLEDRIVKNFFREKQKDYNPPTASSRQRRAPNLLNILTKKPITPLIKEIKINPRSRSAKLRAAQLN